MDNCVISELLKIHTLLTRTENAIGNNHLVIAKAEVINAKTITERLALSQIQESTGVDFEQLLKLKEEHL